MREHAFTPSKRQIIGYILHKAGEGDMGIEGRSSKELATAIVNFTLLLLFQKANCF
jgi:hypothetical protein